MFRFDFPLNQITDWMYALNGEVYGAYTVHLMRSRMGSRECKEHDSAWSLDFGDPKRIRMVPQRKGWFGTRDAYLEKHSMSEATAPSLREQLQNDPSMLTAADENGWTLLHNQALAGSSATVKLLLECGADVNARTANGMTPL